ncbi:hypothetical protein TRIP_B330089 [uncultured Desulfatiglans sp.]|nr:hypothetical protein TRIP_B330089 [uncultured Desulfatiglans sp.]
MSSERRYPWRRRLPLDVLSFRAGRLPVGLQGDEPQAGTQDIRESCKGCGGVLLQAGRPLRRLLQCRYRRDAEYIAIALTGIHGFYESFSQSRVLRGFHPERVFFAHLGVNLPVCLYGGLEVASVQTLDFIDIGKKPHFRIGNPVVPGNHFRGRTLKGHFRGRAAGGLRALRVGGLKPLRTGGGIYDGR